MRYCPVCHRGVQRLESGGIFCSLNHYFYNGQQETKIYDKQCYNSRFFWHYECDSIVTTYYDCESNYLEITRFSSEKRIYYSDMIKDIYLSPEEFRHLTPKKINLLESFLLNLKDE